MASVMRGVPTRITRLMKQLRATTIRLDAIGEGTLTRRGEREGGGTIPHSIAGAGVEDIGDAVGAGLMLPCHHSVATQVMDCLEDVRGRPSVCSYLRHHT